jgi:4,5-dihydroxyphthalate decarboxylase
MSELELTYAGADYMDKTRALMTGRVRPRGIRIRLLDLPVGDLFRRVAQYGEFDAAEMSMSTFLNRLDRGDDRYVAIPVFPSRNFRHGYIFVNKSAGIRRPSDLRGKRVGINDYQLTAAVWQRAFLQHDFAVSPKDITWVQGPLRHPEFVERNEMAMPNGVTVKHVPKGETLENMLRTGQIDALVSTNRPTDLLAPDSTVARLFPNYVEIEAEFYRRTRIYPMMHLVVIKRSVYEANRWVPASLLEAFTDAARIGWRRLAETGTLAVMLPWLAEEIDRIEQVFGKGTPFQHGYAENLHVVDAFCQYHHEQGLSSRRWSPKDIFVPETHNPPVTAESSMYLDVN